MSYVALWDGAQLVRSGGSDPDPGPVASHDWSDANPPWAYDEANKEAQFTAGWPTGLTIVDILGTESQEFETRVTNTLATVPGGGRVVLRLPAGVYHMTRFIPRGSSGNPLYSFGLFQPRLQGFLGAGADKTFIQMDADSLTQAQLDHMATYTKASFIPSPIACIRMDSTASSPTLISGVTFRAADQNLIHELAPDVGVTLPQPAPHGGLELYSNTSPKALIQRVRFQGFGRALLGQPPFEKTNVSSQYGDMTYKRCDFDGRQSPDLDPAQPRRCGLMMGNNEYNHVMEDCWFHHSNVSRYAMNDQNRETSGPYSLVRCKSERIADNRNIDPVYGSLGGYNPTANFGWEDVNGVITVRDPIIRIDNDHLLYGGPKHIDLTTVSTRNPQGGRIYVYGGTFSCVHPGLDGFLLMRPSHLTHWWTDGIQNTVHVYDQEGGTRKQPWRWVSQAETGVAWPPPAGWLAARGITPETHYVIRTA